VSAALHHEVSQFLYGEAQLLEARRFDDWLGLLSEDVEYRIPNWDDAEGASENAMIGREDRTALRARAIRLNHPGNPTQMPRPRVKYFITNVLLGTPDGEELDVQASVLLTLTAPGQALRIHPLTSRYRLRRRGEGWCIARKAVVLLENDQPLAQLPLI
jgi:3-phenylpropionate/cinnamic acid dioxygenase small subunit